MIDDTLPKAAASLIKLIQQTENRSIPVTKVAFIRRLLRATEEVILNTLSSPDLGIKPTEDKT